MEESVIVLDNGGGRLKIAVAGPEKRPSSFPNACARIKGKKHSLLADQILKHGDLSRLALRRPIDRGYVVNWDLQRLIWERSLSSMQSNSTGMGLVITEPLFNPPSLQQQMDQVVFEDLQFSSCCPASSAELCLQFWASEQPHSPSNQALTGLVVDCGFSFSHVIPILDGQLILDGIRRINLGGKALTNYMKELVSFRSINMMEEQYLMEHIKEQTTFTAQDLSDDLVKAKNGEYRLDYVLPDGLTSGTGYVQEPFGRGSIQGPNNSGEEAPTLHLNNERFLVPEVLFAPSNVGLNQGGLAEAIVQSVESCHPDLRPLLWSNILCCGGMFKCPGFIKRLSSEIRAFSPEMAQVKLHTASDPCLTAWLGGNKLALTSAYHALAYTRAQYEEEGSNYMRTH